MNIKNKWKICLKCVKLGHCETTPFGNKIVKSIIIENIKKKWFNPLSFQYDDSLLPDKNDKKLCDNCKYRLEHMVNE